MTERDQYHRILQRNPAPTAKIDCWNNLAELERMGDVNELFRWATQALSLAEQEQYLLGIATSKEHLASGYSRTGAYAKATQLVTEAHQLATENGFAKQEAESLNTLGNIFLSFGNYSEAMNHYLQAERLAESLGDKKLLSSVISNMGNIYGEKQQYDEALKYFWRSLRLDRESGACKSAICTSLLNIGMTLTKQAKYDEAKKYLDEALHGFNEAGDQEGVVFALQALGIVFFKQAQYELAESHYQHALVTVKQQSLRSLHISTLYELARIRSEQGHHEQTLTYLQEALSLDPEEYERSTRMDILHLMAQTFRTLQDYEQALATFEAYHQLRERIFDEQSDYRLKSLQILNDVEKSQHEAQRLRLQNAELEARIAQQVQEHQLQENETLRMALEKERELGGLRSSLMRILSHEFRTPLSVISASAQLLDRYLDQLTLEKREAHIQRILMHVDHIDKMLEDISLVVQTVASEMPFEPKPTDIREVCQDAISHIEETLLAPGRIVFSCDLDDPIISLDTDLLNLSIVQLLENAVLYSDDIVYLRVHFERTLLTIEVEDGGKGIAEDEITHVFDPFYRGVDAQSLHKGTGLGLTIVKECIAVHNGSVSLTSIPHEKTVLTLVIPIE